MGRDTGKKRSEIKQTLSTDQKEVVTHNKEGDKSVTSKEHTVKASDIRRKGTTEGIKATNDGIKSAEKASDQDFQKKKAEADKKYQEMKGKEQELKGRSDDAKQDQSHMKREAGQTPVAEVKREIEKGAEASSEDSRVLQEFQKEEQRQREAGDTKTKQQQSKMGSLRPKYG
jgi:hypothetical protein